MELTEKQKQTLFFLNGLYGVTVNDAVIERKKKAYKELIKAQFDLRKLLLEHETNSVIVYADTDSFKVVKNE